MKLAVIPARGGSKRIPRKNIRLFGGQPMIAWSIQAARASGCFDRIIVSTDDEEIAAVARHFGAEVPFMRPAELADDHAGTIPVVKHATRWFFEQGFNPAAVCCLYATAPFVQAEDLRRGLDILQRGSTAYAFTITRYSYPVQRALSMDAAGRTGIFYPQYETSRSQDLEASFHDAGQFYWGHPESWLNSRPIFSNGTGIILSNDMVQDIDTEEDWKNAELILQILKMRAHQSSPQLDDSLN